MISKEKFIEYMKFLKRQRDFEHKLCKLYRDYRDVVGDAEAIFFNSTDEIISLIEENLGLTIDDYGYTSLSYYIYDLDFGAVDRAKDYDLLKNSLEITTLPEDHKYRHPYAVIKNFEDLYDYLVWEVEYDGNRKEKTN